MMTEAVFAQALLLTGELDDRERALLHMLCDAAASSLALRLKEGLSPQDCSRDFVTAASFYAVAALGSGREEATLEEFRAGDLTVRQSTPTGKDRSHALQLQADRLMTPYFADSFAFVGV